MANTKHVIGLIGNPNCGKTTLFNALTGAHQQVGNWPGVTVERKTGSFVHQGQKIEVVDLPGLYSLDTVDASVSLDEQVARDYVLSGEPNVIVNIVDASNIERNLFLTTQLLEMHIPVILVLNMVDVAHDRGMDIDVDRLSTMLGCPVFKVVAAQKKGIEELKTYLVGTDSFNVTVSRPTYPKALQDAVLEFTPAVEELASSQGINGHWLALKALEGDYAANRLLSSTQQEALQQIRTRTEEVLDDEIDIVTADARYAFIGTLIHSALTRRHEASQTASDKIDKVVLNRILGIPIFLFMMYLMFLFTVNIGGAFNDFFEGFFGAIFDDGLGHLLQSIGCPEWLNIILSKGMGGGIKTVASFVPIIAFLFIFLSILEDSGYMARAAFVMDRFMRFIGLPGKSFVPLIVGFGCNVPAIMATRTLENHRDRVMTIAMSPFMSCGARLPIFALFAVAFFPTGGQNMVFALYLIGILAAIFTGLALKYTVLPGKGAPFIMELPPYHVPTIKGIFSHTWEHLKGFLIRASKVIIPMVMVLNILNAVGTDGSFGHEDTEESVLSSIGKTIAPAFKPMGLTQENWPAAVGVFTGVLAKEAVVGTLNALYERIGNTDEEGQEEPQEPFNLWSALGAAFQTIPNNLSELADKLLDPLGLNAISEVAGESQEQAAQAQEVSASTYTAMVNMFQSKTAAFSYLLLVLLYFPCVAVIGAVAREAGAKWAWFVALWSTGLAYCVSTLFYQIATFGQHPVYSASWIGGIVVLTIIIFSVMRQIGKRNHQKTLPHKVLPTPEEGA